MPLDYEPRNAPVHSRSRLHDTWDALRCFVYLVVGVVMLALAVWGLCRGRVPLQDGGHAESWWGLLYGNLIFAAIGGVLVWRAWRIEARARSRSGSQRVRNGW